MAILYIYTDHVCFHHSLSKYERGETRNEWSFQPDDVSDFCLKLRVGSLAWSLLRLRGSLSRREFSFCARWAELHIFLNKNCKKTSTVFCFCLTKQKGFVVLILLALQSNSAGSVLINDGTLGARIKELKPGVATHKIETKSAPLKIEAVSASKGSKAYSTFFKTVKRT